MKKQFLLISVFSVILSFIGGFILANALNRNEINELRAKAERIDKSATETQNADSEIALSEEEINKKIAESEANPNDFNFQKGLGIGLYRYAALKQDAKLFEKTAKILERAFNLNSKDYDVIVALGNSYFDIGYLKKDDKYLLKGREFYQKALEINPKDSDVITDFALTYYLLKESDIDRTIEELTKAVNYNSRNEKALQVLTEAKIKKNNLPEAEQFLAQLKEVNPNNPTIPNLTSRISQMSGQTQK